MNIQKQQNQSFFLSSKKSPIYARAEMPMPNITATINQLSIFVYHATFPYHNISASTSL